MQLELFPINDLLGSNPYRGDATLQLSKREIHNAMERYGLLHRVDFKAPKSKVRRMTPDLRRLFSRLAWCHDFEQAGLSPGFADFPDACAELRFWLSAN